MRKLLEAVNVTVFTLEAEHTYRANTFCFVWGAALDDARALLLALLSGVTPVRRGGTI